ncbi:MAG: hypothetical protein ACRDRT_10760 [Pseudonocardiaceae bacterium]
MLRRPPGYRPIGVRGYGSNQAGSALLLFPAGVLIMFVLAAMTVDLSAAFLAQRELADAASAVASDAASALAPGSFYRGGRVEPDLEAVKQMAYSRISASLNQQRHQNLAVTVSADRPPTEDCPWAVTVSASSTVDYIFAKNLAGRSGGTVITTKAAAQPQSEAPINC